MGRPVRKINEILICDSYNRILRRNLGKRYEDKDFIDLLKSCGFIYPSICMNIMLKKGYISKTKVSNRLLIVFENIFLTPMELSTIIYNARQSCVKHCNNVHKPIRYISLDELLNGIRNLFNSQDIGRFGILSDDMPDINKLMKVLNIRGQRVEILYHDI